MITINQQEYAYGDINVFLFGQPVLGLRGIDYKTTVNKDYVRGAGRRPRGIQHGAESHEGTLTILQSDLSALNRTAKLKGFKNILGVEFDIVVCYGADNGVLITDKISCASIKELPLGMKEGDLNSEHALPFLALDIELDVI